MKLQSTLSATNSNRGIVRVSAVDWIKNHREELLVGSVIVIAGVAFVAAVAASGGGALILMPLVFVAESTPGLPTASSIAEATR